MTRHPLEPTEEQLRFLEDVAPLRADASVKVLWPLIRDMVLEAAARACREIVEAENRNAGRTDGYPLAIGASHRAAGAVACEEQIRAMKGMP